MTVIKERFANGNWIGKRSGARPSTRHTDDLLKPRVRGGHKPLPTEATRGL